MSSQELLNLLASVPKKAFTPYVEHNEQADAITCYFRPDAEYSKRLSDHVTLFLSLDKDELVGCRIKGIKGLIEDLPNFISVNHNGFDLKCIFWSFLGGIDADGRDALNRLAKEAGDMKLEWA